MVDTLLVISFEELCQVERLNQELIVEVIDYGIAEPVSGDDKNDWMFDTSSVRWVKKSHNAIFSIRVGLGSGSDDC